MNKRCKTGNRLLRNWANKVQAASMGTWSQVMFGSRPYDKHLAKCETCQQATMIKAPIKQEEGKND